jgi:hypothetical protein
LRLGLLSLYALTCSTFADVPAAEELESLKLDVAGLKRDLLLRQEQEASKAAERLAVFVVQTAGAPFSVQTITLTAGGRELASHRYSDKEADALRRGGVHRLLLTRRSPEGLSLEAVMHGVEAGGTAISQRAALDLQSSGSGPVNVQLLVIPANPGRPAALHLARTE